MEGGETNLPAAMNTFCKHIKLTTDIPVFATSSNVLKWHKNDPDEAESDRHKWENDMMASRWRHFELTYQFAGGEMITNIPKCGSCFSMSVLLGENE